MAESDTSIGPPSNKEENQIWSIIANPLNLLVQKTNEYSNTAPSHNDGAGTQQEFDLKRYQKRYQAVMEEVDEVNEEATKTRKQLWETQDKLTESQGKIRELENHCNEVLELREKDTEMINALKVANMECVENENRARESMEIFKKVYKRAQLKLKEDEEEIAILREQRDAAIREKHSQGKDCSSTLASAALKQIKAISQNKEDTMKKILFQAEREKELWKKKHAIEVKRVKNFREQMLVMEDPPSRFARHMEKQQTTIEELEHKLRSYEEKLTENEDDGEERDEIREKDEFDRYEVDRADYSIVNRAFLDEDFDDGYFAKLRDLELACPTLTNKYEF